MIVVDASAVIALLVEPAAESAPIRDRMVGTGEANAPHLLDVEVTSAFRRLVRQGRIGAARCHRALHTFSTCRSCASPIRRWSAGSGSCGTGCPPTTPPMSPSPRDWEPRCSPRPAVARRRRALLQIELGEGPLDRFGDGGGAVGKDPCRTRSTHFGSLP